MRIRILSDLHLEFGPVELPEVEADVVVLAGDVHKGMRGLGWARERFGETPVVYVLGNHEYYGEALPRLREKLEHEAAGSSIHLLENRAVEIGGVSFFGCTLWTDLELHGDVRLAEIEANARMTDFRAIRVSPKYRRLRPADTAVLHRASRRWLAAALASTSPGPRVVVTHHAPSARSLDPRTGWQLVSAAYGSHLDDLVAASGAALWIHGHTHHAVDHRIGETRVLSNPRGYRDETVKGFDAGLVVEVARARGAVDGLRPARAEQDDSIGDS
jgi:predicted phosphodiesterase